MISPITANASAFSLFPSKQTHLIVEFV